MHNQAYGGGQMTVYLDLVVLLNIIVDFLLLVGASRLCGFPVRVWRSVGAAALGGIYAGMCVLPEFRFMGNTLWRLVCLSMMAVVAFGWNRSAIRRGILFVLLSMALGGIALGLGGSGFGVLVAAAAGVCLLCLIGFRGRAGGREYVTVKLTHGSKTRALTALRDTGNTLKDPITGESVLVVGAEIAKELLGMTGEELQSPLETLEKGRIAGLRLIPYRAVGQPGGMLLAARLDDVVIGKQRCGGLVAFAPHSLDNGEEYQALAGGIL